MARKTWIAASVAAIALSASFVAAQDAPESLLPPGFDDPEPTPTPAPATTAAPKAPSVPTPGQPPVPGAPVVQPIPGAGDPVRDLVERPVGDLADDGGGGALVGAQPGVHHGAEHDEQVEHEQRGDGLHALGRVERAVELLQHRRHAREDATFLHT